MSRVCPYWCANATLDGTNYRVVWSTCTRNWSIYLIMRTNIEKQVTIFGFLIHNSHVATYRESSKTVKLSRQGMIVNRLFSNPLPEEFQVPVKTFYDFWLMNVTLSQPSLELLRIFNRLHPSEGPA
jgi:hypothetical protein